MRKGLRILSVIAFPTALPHRVGTGAARRGGKDSGRLACHLSRWQARLPPLPPAALAARRPPAPLLSPGQPPRMVPLSVTASILAYVLTPAHARHLAARNPKHLRPAGGMRAPRPPTRPRSIPSLIRTDGIPSCSKFKRARLTPDSTEFPLSIPPAAAPPPSPPLPTPRPHPAPHPPGWPTRGCGSQGPRPHLLYDVPPASSAIPLVHPSYLGRPPSAAPHRSPTAPSRWSGRALPFGRPPPAAAPPLQSAATRCPRPSQPGCSLLI
jgi:hypothetical protein